MVIMVFLVAVAVVPSLESGDVLLTTTTTTQSIRDDQEPVPTPPTLTVEQVSMILEPFS